MPSPHDWGLAYEYEIREVTEHLQALRAAGSEKLQYVPGLGVSHKICHLDDDEIRSCAIYEAERHVNRAIKVARDKV